MRRILVTGGFGFIGSHLIEKLLREGHHVHVVDNLSSNPIRIQTLMDELGYPRELACSIYPAAQFCQSARAEYDEIYHLASPAGVPDVLLHMGQMIRHVVEDAYAVMGLAIRCKAKLVDVSTSEVYGDGQDGLYSEEMPRIIPANTTAQLEYAIANLAAETAIINMTRVNDALKAVIVRPFNVAGPRQSAKGGFVLPRFVAQAMRNEPLTVFGDGSQVRAFTHVKDVVHGLILAMEQGNSGEAYNLGNPENKITILELAKRVIEIVGEGSIAMTDGKTIYGDAYTEASGKSPNPTKAKHDLDWKPNIGIDQIIKEVWDYMYRAGRLEWLYTPDKPEKVKV